MSGDVRKKYRTAIMGRNSLAELLDRFVRRGTNITMAEINAIVHEVRRENGRRGGQVTSEAKAEANRAKAAQFWADVRAGARPAPKRRKKLKTRKPNKPGERICEPSAGSKYAPLDGSTGGGS